MTEAFAKKLDNYREEYRRIAQKHGLDPEKLKDIMQLSTRGYSRVEIAERIGVNRQTVSQYLKTAREEVGYCSCISCREYNSQAEKRHH